MRPVKMNLCALAALSLTSTIALADSPEVDDIDIRLARAEAVVEGTVESVRFVTSQGDTAIPGVPHTFVTYRIDRVFRGSVGGTTVTLRFFGGLDATGDELVVASNGVEHDVGDRDILLIARNGQTDCPLVDCAYGRYRVIGDAVYDEFGRDVVIVGRERLGRGTARNLPDIFNWAQVGLSTVFDEPLPAPVSGATASAAAFRDFIATRIAVLGLSGGTLPPVTSADPSVPFTYRHPQAVAPPAETTAPTIAPTR